MIIDFHQHFSPGRVNESEVLWRAEKQMTIWARSAGLKREKPLDDIVKERIYVLNDPDGTKLLERMEKAGIDVSVIFIVDIIERGIDEKSILKDNKACADIALRSQGKIVAFASIDPRRENAAQLLTKCIEDYGMRGLKWHPDAGFSPASSEAYEVLEVAQKLKIPLLTHTGCMYGNSKVKFSHPLLLDEVAVDFPELKIVAAHTGHLLWRDWCATSYFKRNIYGDLAEWQVIAIGQYKLFCRFLRQAIDISGMDRILFASDGPGLELVVSNKRWVQIIKDLPRNAPEGIKFTDEEVAAILGNNAKEILDI